jgi:hypothetical protein
VIVAVSVVEPGGVCVWRESRVWSQAVDLVLVVLTGSAFNRHEDIFLSSMYLIKKYKFRDFNSICKDNAAINFIAVKQKKIYFRQL